MITDHAVSILIQGKWKFTYRTGKVSFNPSQSGYFFSINYTKNDFF